MRTAVLGLLLGGLLGLLAACGSPDPTSTPVAPAGGADAPDTREAWEVQWDELQVKAREEGELVIIGGSAAVVYRPLFKFFGDKYGIKVRSSGGSSRELVDRILAERNAGRFTIDLFISGLGTSLERLVPNGVLQPVERLLFLPDVIDLSNWEGNRRRFVDPGGEYIISYAATAGSGIEASWYNTNLLTTEDVRSISSVWDYLDKDWRFVTTPPAAGLGAGGGWTSRWWAPDVGPEWVEAWIRNPNVTWLTDARAIQDGVVRGSFDLEIMTAGVGGEFERLQELAAPIANIDQDPIIRDQWRDINFMSGTASGDIVSAVDRPLNPNAQQLLLNWWLSHEGQTQRHILTTDRNPSPTLRDDVTEWGNTLPEERREPGKEYAFIEDTPGYDPVQGLEDMAALWDSIHR